MFDKETGFTKVIQMLIDAKKPLVGHNPQYDVAFMYEQFIGPLPDTFIEFCEEWRKSFPMTYDTKAIYSEFAHGTWGPGVKSFLNLCFEAIVAD